MASRFNVLLLAGLVAACTADTGETADQAEETAAMAAEAADLAALDAVRESYQEHYNLHHASMVADMYADSAVWLSADGGVFEGKEAILAQLETAMAATPTLNLVGADRMVFGDFAVQRGTYTVQMNPPEGEARTMTGYYMTGLTRENGEWKIAAVVTNLDSEPPADMQWMEPEGEPPPEEGTMTALVEAYETHYNLGHASMVADLFTENAFAAFPNQPASEGRAAIEAALTEGLANGSPKIDIHDVGSMELGNGFAMDGGWYTVTVTTEAGEVQNTGTYMSLTQQQADGSWKLHWLVGNGHPMQGN